jgi:hypothetical protein
MFSLRSNFDVLAARRDSGLEMLAAFGSHVGSLCSNCMLAL